MSFYVEPPTEPDYIGWGYEPGPGRNPLEEQAEDEAATGRPRCVGCGRFLKKDADWNQCADCDTREEGLSAFFA